MKRHRLATLLVGLVVLVSSMLSILPAAAQEAVTHESIIAQIPDLENLAAQAPTTFVGDVEGSYAYIAFVIQDNLAVIYVCDSLEAWGWIRAEVVNGEIHVTDEKTGMQIDAVVTDAGVTGTIVLAVDDDGTTPVAHDFTTVPAVPGETGLARYADEFEVAGWIVTENGVRGIRKFLDCRGMKREVATLQNLMSMTSDVAVRGQIADQIVGISVDATIAGCGNINT
jgi:hypothetical protein